MKKLFLLVFVLTTAYPPVQAQPTEEEAIRNVITSAYIEGIHNRGNVEDIRKGFHPSFNMLRLAGNEIKPLPIEEWIASLEKAKRETAPGPRATGKFVSVDVSGNAAVVKLDLYKENKKIFTDYLALYKFAEGWRIVSKTFFRHN